MSIGLVLPTTAAGASGEQILGFARIADQGGLHSVWTIDRLVFPLIEAFSTLAAAAGVTSRVKLGTNVLIAPAREPLLVAVQAASIDVLSNGRMLLGMGVGSREEDYLATQRDFHTRGRRLEADLAAMRRVWAGESVVEGFGALGPRPVQPTIPVIFGGSSDRAMARAARIGDGYACVPRGLARQAELFTRFREQWHQQGRAGQPFLVAQGYYYVDDSPFRARERILDYQQHYYGTRPRASGGISESEFDLVGPPEAIAEAAARYLALGPSVLVLLPASADLAQAEAIAGPVMEHLRRDAPGQA